MTKKIEENVLKRLLLIGPTLRAELFKWIIGQNKYINLLIDALIGSFNVYTEGPPGSAKTLPVKILGKHLDVRYGSLQGSEVVSQEALVGHSVLISRKENVLKQLFSFITGGSSHIEIDQIIKRGGINTADLFFINEITRIRGKARAVLLEILNERVFQGVAVPLRMAVSDSNPADLSTDYYIDPLNLAELDRFVGVITKSNLDKGRYDECFEIARRYEFKEKNILESVQRGTISIHDLDLLSSFVYGENAIDIPDYIQLALVWYLRLLIREFGFKKRFPIKSDRAYFVQAPYFMRANALSWGRMEISWDDFDDTLYYFDTFRISNDTDILKYVNSIRRAMIAFIKENMLLFQMFKKPSDIPLAWDGQFKQYFQRLQQIKAEQDNRERASAFNTGKDEASELRQSNQGKESSTALKEEKESASKEDVRQLPPAKIEQNGKQWFLDILEAPPDDAKNAQELEKEQTEADQKLFFMNIKMQSASTKLPIITVSKSKNPGEDHAIEFLCSLALGKSQVDQIFKIIYGHKKGLSRFRMVEGGDPMRRDEMDDLAHLRGVKASEIYRFLANPSYPLPERNVEGEQVGNDLTIMQDVSGSQSSIYADWSLQIVKGLIEKARELRWPVGYIAMSDKIQFIKAERYQTWSDHPQETTQSKEQFEENLFLSDSASITEIYNGLRKIRYGGATNYELGFLKYIEKLQALKRFKSHHYLVFTSDGLPNIGDLELEKPIRLLAENRISVIPVFIFYPDAGVQYPEILKKIAESTGIRVQFMGIPLTIIDEKVGEYKTEFAPQIAIFRREEGINLLEKLLPLIQTWFSKHQKSPFESWTGSKTY